MVDFWQRMLWSAERLSHSAEFLAIALVVLLSFKWFARDLVFFTLKSRAVKRVRKKRVWDEGYICRVIPGLSFYAPSPTAKSILGPSVIVDTSGPPIEIDKEEIERIMDFLTDVLDEKIRVPQSRSLVERRR